MKIRLRQYGDKSWEWSYESTDANGDPAWQPGKRGYTTRAEALAAGTVYCNEVLRPKNANVPAHEEVVTIK